MSHISLGTNTAIGKRRKVEDDSDFEIEVKTTTRTADRLRRLRTRTMSTLVLGLGRRREADARADHTMLREESDPDALVHRSPTTMKNTAPVITRRTTKAPTILVLPRETRILSITLWRTMKRCNPCDDRTDTEVWDDGNESLLLLLTTMMTTTSVCHWLLSWQN